MISETCYYYFDQALTQGASMQLAMTRPQVFLNGQGDCLSLMVCEQGDLVFQIKAPVYPTAAIAVIKEWHDQGKMNISLEAVCKAINCPETHRHQVQWVLESYRTMSK
jgi:hypothetical protein